MVKEIVIVFGMEDILQLRMSCSKCGGEVSLCPAKSSYRVPDKCPHCHEVWWDSNKPVSEQSVVNSYKNLLNELRFLMTTPLIGDSPATIRFEIDGEDHR